MYSVAKTHTMPSLQVIFRKRATNYRALLRKMTYKDKASYDSTPPCTTSVILDVMCVFSISLRTSRAQKCVRETCIWYNTYLTHVVSLYTIYMYTHSLTHTVIECLSHPILSYTYSVSLYNVHIESFPRDSTIVSLAHIIPHKCSVSLYHMHVESLAYTIPYTGSVSQICARDTSCIWYSTSHIHLVSLYTIYT